MKKVLVTSYSTGGQAGGAHPTENVTLNFKEVESTYTSSDSAERRSALIVGDMCK